MALSSVARCLSVSAVLVDAMRTQRHNGRTTELSASQVQVKGAPLCDPEIIAEGCRAMDWDNSGGDVVSVYEVSMMMSATRPSTLQYLREIGSDVGRHNPYWHMDVGDGGGEMLSCSDLCEKSLAKIDDSVLPPTSDVGCRIDLDSDERVCDIDLSPESFAEIQFPAKFEHFAGNYSRPQSTEGPLHHNSKYLDLKIQGHHIDPDAGLVALTPSQALIKVANLFRIYPMVPTTFDSGDGSGSDSSFAETEVQSNTTYTSVHFAEEGKCRDGCKRFPAHCKRYPLSCSGCRQCQAEAEAPTPETATSAPGRLSQPLPPRKAKSSVPSWYAAVEMVNVKAQAYVAHAVKIALKEQSCTKCWFGTGADSHRQEIIRVLNSVDSMLSNVVYIQGPECDDDDFAYVYPVGSKAMTEKGQYKFFLCDLYFDSKLDDQIATLTHEGSHHRPAYTDDVCVDDKPESECETAYGKGTCRGLAKKHPLRAVKNGDNFCYYINDLNRHKGSIQDCCPV